MPRDGLALASPALPVRDADGYGLDDLAGDLSLSPTAMADLMRFRDLLEEANANLNLVGPSALATFWRRHALDSGQLLALSNDARTWADLGAGAGFPGLVLAVCLKGVAGAQVHLVDSQAKRCRFLRSVTDTLSLPATVHWARAETLAPVPAVDVVTARACAPLARLFGYALPFMKQGARGLFLKGQGAEVEIAEARKSWRFEATLRPSRSDAGGRIVSVEGLQRA